MTAPTQTGRVKFYDVRKGYGFIQADDGSGDVFLPQSAIEAAGLPYIVPGDRVQFEVTRDKQGRPRASNLAVTAGRAA